MRRAALFLATALTLALPLALPTPSDAKGKMKFMDVDAGKLDQIRVDGRVVPVSDLDPGNEIVGFSISNIDGIISGKILPPGSMKPNGKHTTFKYRSKKDGTYKVLSLIIKSKLDRETGELNYLIRVKAEGDCWMADPARTTTPETDLANMTTVFWVGDDGFYVDAGWERKSFGWFLADKHMTAY